MVGFDARCPKKREIDEMYEGIRRIVTMLGLCAQTGPRPDAVVTEHPFGSEIWAGRDDYLARHEEARAELFPSIDAIERSLGFALDRDWMEELALHTQVVIKKSRLNYQHGRILYTYLRQYCSRCGRAPLVVLETGTARGFSALCMARALDDAGIAGFVVTVDQLPHNRAFLWNCIDDHDGPKTRQELLTNYQELLRRIMFVEGPTPQFLPRLGLGRVNFAFLDAAHTHDAVMSEYLDFRG